jgi:hypothetical protein
MMRTTEQSYLQLSTQNKDNLLVNFIKTKEYLKAIPPIIFWTFKSPKISGKIQHGISKFISMIETFPSYPNRYFIEAKNSCEFSSLQQYFNSKLELFNIHNYLQLKEIPDSTNNHFLIQLTDQPYNNDYGKIIGRKSKEYYVLVLPRIDFQELHKRGFRSERALIRIKGHSYLPEPTYFDRSSFVNSAAQLNPQFTMFSNLKTIPAHRWNGKLFFEIQQVLPFISNCSFDEVSIPSIVKLKDQNIFLHNHENQGNSLKGRIMPVLISTTSSQLISIKKSEEIKKILLNQSKLKEDFNQAILLHMIF